ncbi:hypothetical protein [Paenibacillus tianmuensis]|uniref:hypothetical protein n=1 Tax=Paenibacillus tianmuensis TaxID=624147 RepID=UPI000B841014|nr:hypothetical protein [Paenibacillus tianmuensis]
MFLVKKIITTALTVSLITASFSATASASSQQQPIYQQEEVSISPQVLPILPILWEIGTLITVGATTFTVYTVHERNTEIAEKRAKECTEKGGVAETENQFFNIGYKVT